MSYQYADGPAAIGARMVAELDEFLCAREARIGWVFSRYALRLHGQPKAAFIAVPKLSGPFSDFFAWALDGVMGDRFDEPLDFVVFIDVGIYESYPTDAHRERLVYHELSHIEHKTNQWGAPQFDQDGRPVLRLRGHDTEVFDQEVARYGAKVCGLESHVAALKRSRTSEHAAKREY